MVVSEIALLFLREIGGGLAFGAILGFIGYKLMLLVEEKPLLATMITIAIVTGGYAVSHILHISGPLAMVEAGLIIGQKIRIDKICQRFQNTITDFWKMMDKIINAITFLLMGLLLLLVDIYSDWILLIFVTVIIVLFGRFIGIIIPFSILGHTYENKKNATVILTWGGLRGGVSIALALGISDGSHGHIILFITLFVVSFSLIVQGLTIGKVYKKLCLNM